MMLPSRRRLRCCLLAFIIAVFRVKFGNSFNCRLPFALPARTSARQNQNHEQYKSLYLHLSVLKDSKSRNDKFRLFQSSVGYDTNMEDHRNDKAKTSTDKSALTTTTAITALSQELPSTNNSQNDDINDCDVEDVEDLEMTQRNKEITKKILNGLLLAASFGYAAYTIFNIDAGMTRGWTQQEIAMRIPLDNWLNYESSLADRPIFTKTAINVIIYLLGDWLSQTVFKGQNILDFDAGRTLKNGLIGLCFGPLVHEYYQFSDYILPVEGGMWNRFEKILMDQTIYLIVKCSIYIAAVGFLAGESTATVKNNVQTKLPGIVVTAWKFWPLVHLVTYGLIPARHRILWVNCVDLVWNAILASMSQKKEEPIKIIVAKDDDRDQQQQPMIWETSANDETRVDIAPMDAIKTSRNGNNVELPVVDNIVRDDVAVNRNNGHESGYNNELNMNFQNETLADNEATIVKQ